MLRAQRGLDLSAVADRGGMPPIDEAALAQKMKLIESRPETAVLTKTNPRKARRASRMRQAATTYPQSCAELLAAQPDASSGLYEVKPPGALVITVWCDMDTAGGGWTLCGKFDRDNAANASHLTAGFGREPVQARYMQALPLPLDGSVSQASIDCRLRMVLVLAASSLIASGSRAARRTCA